jgi:predicted O-methyltransferase YrrM
MGKVFAHYLRVLFGSELPHTQTTQAERDLLTAHLPGRKRIVEIGVFEGFTTRLLAQHSDPDATVYAVDRFFTGRIGISWGLRIASAYNRKHLATGRLKLVRALSTHVGNHVPPSVDYVFIDADHSLEGITADWAFWSSRLESGGIIALHDTVPTSDRAIYGSHQYFQSYIQYDPLFEIVAQRDSLSVLAKR